MKKLNAYLILVVCLMTMFGCNKSEDLNITMNVVEDGNLNIYLLNDNGTGIGNTEVQLKTSSSLYGEVLEEKTTDNNGLVSFNNILSGTYNIYVKKVTVGSSDYTVNQIVQVINSATKEYQIKPTEYSGSAEFTIFSQSTYNPISGINVIIFPSSDYSYGMSYSDVLSIATATGVTDSMGIVSFSKLPFNIYNVLVYEGDILNERGQFFNYYYIESKDDEIKDDLYYYDYK